MIQEWWFKVKLGYTAPLGAKDLGFLRVASIGGWISQGNVSRGLGDWGAPVVNLQGKDRRAGAAQSA